MYKCYLNAYIIQPVLWYVLYLRSEYSHYSALTYTDMKKAYSSVSVIYIDVFERKTTLTTFSYIT